jgi:hypothetical protein
MSRKTGPFAEICLTLLGRFRLQYRQDFWSWSRIFIKGTYLERIVKGVLLDFEFSCDKPTLCQCLVVFPRPSANGKERQGLTYAHYLQPFLTRTFALSPQCRPRLLPRASSTATPSWTPSASPSPGQPRAAKKFLFLDPFAQ